MESQSRMSTLAVLVRATVLTAAATFLLDRLRSSRAADTSALSPSGAITLFAGHLTLAALAILAGALGALAGRWMGKLVPRPRWLADVAAVASVWIAIAAWPLLRAGVELASGAWISEQSWSILVRFAPLACWIALAPLVAVLAFQRSTSKRRRTLVTAGLALAAIGLEIVDHRFQPGQYPELHMIAHAGALVCIAVLATWAAPYFGRSRWVPAIGAALCIVAPAIWLTMSSTTRAELLLRSSATEHWIRHATPRRKQEVLRGLLTELDSTEGRYVPADELDAGGGGIDAREMNVVLVVVDTMRADTLPPARDAADPPWAQPNDTPFIDEWLAGTYQFTRAYAAATNTGRSTPTLMRSIQSFDDPYDGVPIGVRMQAQGYATVAVVLDFFISGKQKPAAALLEGFDDVQIFERAQTGDAVPVALQQIERVRDRPFLAWVHIYALHEPGFDGRLLSAEDCSRIECYRRSLQWLDGQMRDLIDGLERLDIAKNTVVVLAADHGEGLGDHGKWLHGALIYDEVLHVPMAFSIPGQRGGRIDSLVGNIDLVPTIMDLLGAGSEPTDRGRSLVPLMLGRPDVAPRAYYAETARSTFSAVVRGYDKLIFDIDSDVFHRFDLVADPREQVDIFDPSTALDRDLMQELASFKPEIFADELENEEVRALLAQRMDEIDPARPGAALPFLVRLVAARPTPELVDRAVSLAEQSTDRGLRLLVLRYLWRQAQTRLEQMLAAWIADLDKSGDELAVIAALAAQGQPVFAARAVARRMKRFADRGTVAAWEPYLRLVKDWDRRTRDFAPVLTSMLERSHKRSRGGPDARLLSLVLESVGGLSREGRGDQAIVDALAVEVRSFMSHPDTRVRAAALHAVAALHDTTSVESVRARLLDAEEDVRVRRAAVDAIADLRGAAATEDLIAVGDEPRLTNSVVVKLRTVGSSDALPFLQRMSEEHHNPYTRKDATKAIARIEGRTGDVEVDEE